MISARNVVKDVLNALVLRVINAQPVVRIISPTNQVDKLAFLNVLLIPSVII